MALLVYSREQELPDLRTGKWQPEHGTGRLTALPAAHLKGALYRLLAMLPSVIWLSSSFSTSSAVSEACRTAWNCATNSL